MELDLGAVRAFVAVAQHRHFGAAADELALTQQAISKRIAKLEADLGVALLRRTRGGAELTPDGNAFWPHARGLIAVADQATDAVRRRNRPLRVDVITTRFGPTEMVRRFHEAVDRAEIDLVTSDGLRSALPALLRGSVDAAFVRTTGPLDEAIARTPAELVPLHLLVGRRHQLARRRRVRVAELAGRTVWMPGNHPGLEWTDYYLALAEEMGIRIDASGPHFGFDAFLDDIGASTELSTFVGAQHRLPWNPGIVRLPIIDPVPVYPATLIWHRDNQHPTLPAFVDHVRAGYQPPAPRDVLLPAADRAAFDLLLPD